MPKLNTTSFLLLLLLLLLLSLLNTAISGQAPAPAKASDFINSECRATRYPTLCIQCLSNHSATIQNHRQLAQAALSVSLSRAQSAATFISKLARMKGLKPSEVAAVKDCIANVGSSVDQLSRSTAELGRLAEQDFEWHVGNVMTWVSAALTNEKMCLDGFSSAAMDGNVKAAIRRRVVICEQVTSNALALVHRFAARHKAK